MVSRRFTAAALALGLAALASPGADAQRVIPDQSGGQQQQQPGNAEERAAQLRATVASITTPDRDLNLANFEQIMESNDVRRIEIAIRTLIASEDPVLRGIAMRGYIAVTQSIIFDVALPADVMRIVEQSRNSQNPFQGIAPPHSYITLLSFGQFRVSVHFQPTGINSVRGVVAPSAPVAQAAGRTEYVVRGDRITFEMAPAFINGVRCSFELRPERNAHIAGTMTCSDRMFTRPIALIAPMF